MKAPNLKASPVEHELVCECGHEVRLVDGRLYCFHNDQFKADPIGCRDPNRENEPIAWAMRDLVRSGRTRARQFTTYPTPEVFR